MNKYIKKFYRKKTKKKVVCSKTESKSLFRFGYGVDSMSIKNVNISIVIGVKKMLLKVDVVYNVKIGDENRFYKA